MGDPAYIPHARYDDVTEDSGPQPPPGDVGQPTPRLRFVSRWDAGRPAKILQQLWYVSRPDKFEGCVDEEWRDVPLCDEKTGVEIV
jgi:hypothetical protein